MKKKQNNEKIDKFDRPAYKGFTLAQAAMRPNSLKVLEKPSRIVNSLLYPDGRLVWNK